MQGSTFADLVALIKESTVLGLLIISEIALWSLRKYHASKFAALRNKLEDANAVEQASLAYYRKRNILGIVRIGIILFLVLIGVLFYDIQAFSFLAVALGAIVINQKDSINSLFAYFYIVSNYRVGDDVKVGTTLGEIVQMSSLQTTLAGKEESGEYSGKRITVPNFQFMNQAIEVQELKTTTYRRVVIRAVYTRDSYTVDFSTFVEKVRGFLKEFLPKRNLSQVGNFRSYVNTQFRINFDYNDDGDIIVRIGFISRPHDILDRKEQIIEFIESMRLGHGTSVVSAVENEAS